MFLVKLELGNRIGIITPKQIDYSDKRFIALFSMSSPIKTAYNTMVNITTWPAQSDCIIDLEITKIP